MVHNPYDIKKQIQIVKEFFSSTSMTINVDKKKNYDNQIQKDHLISCRVTITWNLGIYYMTSYNYLGIYYMNIW